MAAAEEARPKGVFITGTDTGVGKTLVAAALARFLNQRGMNIGVMKVVETGVEDPATLGPDARLLQWAANCRADADVICPYRLRTPVAPDVAAKEERVRLELSRMADAARQLSEESDFLIVEGVGGLMVPLAGGFLVADLARQMALPLLIVARPDLGTINHTLLTVFAARTMNLPTAGFLINGMPKVPGVAEKTAPHSLSALASADLLGVLERVEGDDQTKVDALVGQIGCLPTLSWLGMNLGLPHGIFT
ncbi:MAG TPA: dethiobiotin synthase [Gammaproteobacteria bacterium]|nr:dethiobiotin synthase [Gammaproteobacteria bacterium]